MKVIIANQSDSYGGAARAAYRVHSALRGQAVDSRMFVNEAKTGDWSVRGPRSRWQKGVNLVRSSSSGVFSKVTKTKNPILHSAAILPSSWPRRLNTSDADVVNLHWVNGEMISIAGVGKLSKPVVWTLHDMWAFCGAEHYTEDLRWRVGYASGNRPSQEGGFDLTRWTWKRKKRHWRRRFHIVTPSHWLAHCVRESSLMRSWPVSVVPNPIDTQVWKPIDRTVARDILNLPPESPLLLFGALGGLADPRKGFDLLRSALNHMKGEIQGLELTVFGQLAPRSAEDLGFPVHYTGHLHDDVALRLLYSAADAMIVPSRQDNLPNTVMEAMTCGTPCVAFQIGGLPDMIEHLTSGYLAKPFDGEDLARGILWVLEDEDRRTKLGRAARKYAEEKWSYPVVAEQYLAVYEKALQQSF